MDMRKMAARIVVSVMLAGWAQAGESFYLVKLQSMDRRTERQVMNAADYKELQITLKKESKVFSKAVSEAQKAWQADELNKGIPFCGGRLTERKILGTETFSSQEAADAALSRYEESEARRKARQEDRKKEQAQMMSRMRGNQNTASKKIKEEREAKREKDLAYAAEQVQSKVSELLGKESAGAAGEAKEAKGEGAEKVKEKEEPAPKAKKGEAKKE
jgi:hypothetical protein